jgi:hypothetical protein
LKPDHFCDEGIVILFRCFDTLKHTLVIASNAPIQWAREPHWRNDKTLASRAPLQSVVRLRPLFIDSQYFPVPARAPSPPMNY